MPASQTAQPAAGLTLCLLGVPRLVHADGGVQPLERKDAALLAMLALDGPALRSKLAALLWPDVPERVARGNLRQRLFRLRAAAARDVVQAAGALRLADDLALDITQLHHHLVSDPQAGHGDLLASHDYSDQHELARWVEGARERWRGTRLNLLAQVASDLETQRQVAAALPYAQRMLADEPLLEHAHRRLMRLHYLRGDRAAALAAYERCHAALGRELGLRPSAETVQLARLVESSGALPQPAPAPRPTGALRPPRLVGRDAEWRALAHGGVVLVTGEPGIGKSRLISDFATATANDGALLGGARPGDARLPYASLARLVRALVERFGAPAAGWPRNELARIVPELGQPPRAALDALRVQSAAVALLEQARASGLKLLVFDDLHFADDTTLGALPSLVSALEDMAVPVLLAARASEMPSALMGWLQAQDTTVRRVALGPLTLESVRALLESLAIPDLDAAAWAPPMAGHTGGNPLFILETLIALLDSDPSALAGKPVGLPAPSNVATLIDKRLTQLDASALKLARLAALASADFSVALAAAVLGRHALDIADDWRALQAAAIFRDDAFAHDLVFEAVLRSVPAPIARSLHRDIAAHLEAHAGMPARTAGHWFDAGEWPPAAAAYEKAARAASAASHHADEVRLWERAITSHENAGNRAGAFAARCASVKALLSARPLNEAGVLTERLLEDAQTDAERLDALIERATVLVVDGHAAAAEPLAREASELAQRLALPWRAFDAARGLALALALTGRAAEGAALLDGFEAVIERGGDTTRQHQYWSDRAYVLNEAGRRRESSRAFQRAADSAQALGDLNELVTCRTNLAITLVQFGEAGAAFEQAVLAQRLRSDLGESDDLVAGAADMNVASFGLLIGRFDTALACYETALGRFRKGNSAVWVAAAESNLASAWLQLGQTARARQALTPVATDAVPAYRARRLVIEGRIERVLGRSPLAHIQQALEVLGEHGDATHRVLAELDRSRQIEATEAIAACRRCRHLAEAQELFGAAMKARLYELDGVQRRGDTAAASELAHAIWAASQNCRPVDMYWGEALWLIGRAIDASGDATAAAVLQEARRWVTEEALPHVPAPFRDTFLQRHSVNVPLLDLARRRLGPAATAQ